MTTEAQVDIIFECPHCTGSLVTDISKIGIEVACPHCTQPLTIPKAPPVTDSTIAPGVRRLNHRSKPGDHAGKGNGSKGSGTRPAPPMSIAARVTPAEGPRLRSDAVLDAELKKMTAAYHESQKEVENLRRELKQVRLQEAASKVQVEETQHELITVRRELELNKEQEMVAMEQIDLRFKDLQRQLDRSVQRMTERDAEETKLKVALGRLESGALEVLRFLSQRQRGETGERK